MGPNRPDPKRCSSLYLSRRVRPCHSSPAVALQNVFTFSHGFVSQSALEVFTAALLVHTAPRPDKHSLVGGEIHLTASAATSCNGNFTPCVKLMGTLSQTSWVAQRKGLSSCGRRLRGRWPLERQAFTVSQQLCRRYVRRLHVRTQPYAQEGRRNRASTP